MTGPQYQKLFSLGARVYDGQGRTKKPSSPEIRSVYEAFNQNMMRVVRLIDNPPFLVGWSITFQTYLMKSLFEIYQTGDPSEEQLKDHELAEKQKKAQQQFFAEDMTAFTSDPHGRIMKSIEFGLFRLEEMCGFVPPIAEGISVTLASVITGSWTAIEVLLGDLWEAAVNAQPECMLPTDARSARQKSRLVPLRLIRDHDYDLRGKMGSVLRRRINFTRMTTIRTAYHKAFRDGKIDDLLSDPAITILHNIRNILVHKGGRVDSEFIGNLKNVAGLNTLKANDPLVLNGAIVEERVMPVIERADDLIDQVDKWAIHHSKK